jgi:hypothetical protein
MSRKSLPCSAANGGDMLRDFRHHPRIGFACHILAAEPFRDGDDAKRDRHPRLDPRRRFLFRGIALDPDQFGRTAADIEQDGAPPFGSSSGEQPITASVASVSRSITSSRMPVSLAPRRESCRHWRRRGRLGCDQPQAVGLAVADLVAADAQRRDGAVDRRLADGTGRRDALRRAG